MISLDETALWELMNGTRTDPVQIGWLHPSYRRTLGTHASAILASPYTIDHIALGRHGSRYYSDLCLTPAIIYYGACALIAPNKLAFVLSNYDTVHKPYKSVIKATRDRTELYLESTHRIQNGQERKLMRMPHIARW